jgi:transposase
MLKKLKNLKNKPIDKELIKTCNYYIPYFQNEKTWKKIKLTTTWFDILYYNYKLSNNHNKLSNNNYNSSNKICSIDVGCKNFISLYGLDGYCYKIKSDYKKIDKILKNNKLNYSSKDNLIKNLIHELHIESAKLICSKYDIIYVGLVNNKGNINSKNMNTIEDNLLKIVSHKEFLDTLLEYANVYNKDIKIVEESFTSVQCGVCGEFNKFGRIFNEDDSERRKYTCKHCNNQFCRDINAARNILIKNQYK